MLQVLQLRLARLSCLSDLQKTAAAEAPRAASPMVGGVNALQWQSSQAAAQRLQDARMTLAKSLSSVLPATAADLEVGLTITWSSVDCVAAVYIDGKLLQTGSLFIGVRHLSASIRTPANPCKCMHEGR